MRLKKRPVKLLEALPYLRRNMEEINPFLLDTEKTKPSFESDVAKWYLIRKGEYYACWRWDSKKDGNNRKYLITTKDGGRIIKDTHSLEEMFIIFDALEATEGR